MHYDPVDFVRSSIRSIPDWPKPGVMFRDITPVLQDPRCFRALIDIFVYRYMRTRLDLVAGVDARGEDYELEYGQASVEIHTDAVKPGQRVLLVDDLIATGGTLLAASRLLHRLGANVVEAAAIIDLPELGGSKVVRESGLPVFSLFEY